MEQRQNSPCHCFLNTVFDNISHGVILEAIASFPAGGLIKAWLKAGIMENGVFSTTEAGTPQGGIISPLLANIAFHGMESAIGVTYDLKGMIKGKRALVRYADDCVPRTY
jgi:RNA-directed DNA polymerase